MILSRLRRASAILLVLLPLTLSGCIPLIILASAAGTIAIVTDKRSIKTMLQDRHSAQTAQNLIDMNRELKGRSHISVAVFNHIALIVGETQTPKLRALAYRLVSQVKDIKRIYNEVQISGAISLPDRTNDSWLTTKVKTALAGTDGLRSSQIKVVTENSVVYLMGILTRKQGDIAANAVRRIDGVRKVVKVFQYQKEDSQS